MSLQVSFDVPAQILQGLANGTLERVGGIIRDQTTKQVVSWLRDTDIIGTGMSLIPNPINLIVQAGQAALSLYDGHLTRHAIGGLGSQITGLSGQVADLSTQVAGVSGQIQGIGRSIGLLGSMTSFVAGGQILNLGVSAISLYVIQRRLERLLKSVEQMGERIVNEIKRDRDIGFKTALQAARDVFDQDGENLKEQAARSAIDGLFEARENFLHDFEALIEPPYTLERLKTANQILIRALYAESSRVRCSHVMNGTNFARKRLSEDLERFQQSAVKLVQGLLGTSQALFFYKSTSATDLDRFLVLRRWLQSPNDIMGVPAAESVFAVLNELRTEFWDQGIIWEDPRDKLA